MSNYKKIYFPPFCQSKQRRSESPWKKLVKTYDVLKEKKTAILFSAQFRVIQSAIKCRRVKRKCIMYIGKAAVFNGRS